MLQFMFSFRANINTENREAGASINVIKCTTLLVIPVFFLLWQVKISVKKAYFQLDQPLNSDWFLDMLLICLNLLSKIRDENQKCTCCYRCLPRWAHADKQEGMFNLKGIVNGSLYKKATSDFYLCWLLYDLSYCIFFMYSWANFKARWVAEQCSYLR